MKVLFNWFLFFFNSLEWSEFLPQSDIVFILLLFTVNKHKKIKGKENLHDLNLLENHVTLSKRHFFSNAIL